MPSNLHTKFITVNHSHEHRRLYSAHTQDKLRSLLSILCYRSSFFSKEARERHIETYSFANFMKLPLETREKHIFYNCEIFLSMPVWYGKKVNRLATPRIQSSSYPRSGPGPDPESRATSKDKRHKYGLCHSNKRDRAKCVGGIHM